MTIVNDDILFGDNTSFYGGKRSVWVRYEGMVMTAVVIAHYGLFVRKLWVSFGKIEFMKP